jgi:hypothetical protein
MVSCLSQPHWVLTDVSLMISIPVSSRRMQHLASESPWASAWSIKTVIDADTMLDSAWVACLTMMRHSAAMRHPGILPHFRKMISTKGLAVYFGLISVNSHRSSLH